MAIRQDTQGTELAQLLALASGFAGKRVLEVGCGAGRLTWRYAGLAAHVVAIDHNPDEIARAEAAVPYGLRRQVELQASSILDYEPAAGAMFDVVILSWSL